MLILTPAAILGLLLFAVVLGLTVGPLVYGVICFLDGSYVLALLALALWIVWLRYARPVCRYILEGFEHGNL